MCMMFMNVCWFICIVYVKCLSADWLMVCVCLHLQAGGRNIWKCTELQTQTQDSTKLTCINNNISWALLNIYRQWSNMSNPVLRCIPCCPQPNPHVIGLDTRYGLERFCDAGQVCEVSWWSCFNPPLVKRVSLTVQSGHGIRPGGGEGSQSHLQCPPLSAPRGSSLLC